MSTFSRRVFGRREFLVATSASIVTAALHPRVFAAEGAGAAPVKRLAVGFAHTAGKAHLIDAASIPSGDGTFIGVGAHVAVSGSSGTTDNPRDRRVVELIANFSYFEGATLKSAPFHAWGANRVTGEQGVPIRFPVPIDLLQTLSLTVVVESGELLPGAAISRRRAVGSPGGTFGATSLPLVFSVRNDPTAIPLLRGYYVVVPLIDSESAPDWSRYHLSQVDGRWTLVNETGAPAGFEHLVLSVSYGAS
jgi:hypothetical protein